MSWFMRGVQSAIFHYVSCAPCTGYHYRTKRRKQAKRDRKAKRILEMEQPDLYRHPEPSGTNPYWTEEIVLGPGPPPRRAGKKTNIESRRGITTAGTQSTVVSQAGSSIDIDQSEQKETMRMSDDTLDGDNWNRKRYQREDEELWGFGAAENEPDVSGSSVGVVGLSRPATAKSSSESYYAPRNPPVNDLHPPVVSNPSPHPSANRWMLQPPPKASIMNGKERATRSRSGSGASSRVELNLQRQVSARQLRAKLERGETPEMPPLSRGSSYNNFHSVVQGQRHDRDPKAPNARPPSAASSRRRKRRDTALSRTQETEDSSGTSSDTIVRPASRISPSPSRNSSLKVVRVRSSRQVLSTVVSSGSGSPGEQADNISTPSVENEVSGITTSKRRPRFTTHTSSESVPYSMKHRSPLNPSDISSLNVLQDLVSPRALLNSRFVSAPLMEARIKLPPSDKDEETILVGVDAGWTGSGFATSRAWMDEDEHVSTKDFGEVFKRDPRMRWSVDF